MASRLKVLHLIETLSSGGAERQLVNLVQNTSRDIEHVVCVIRDSDFFADKVEQAGHRVIDLGIRGKHPFVRTVIRLRKIIAGEQPDILQSWLYDANVSLRLANLPFNRLPIITALQLPDYEPDAARVGSWSPLKVRALRYLDKLTAVLTAPEFIACSEFVSNSYRQHFGVRESKISVIYNSVDHRSLMVTCEQSDLIREEFDFLENSFVCLNVGRLDPQKNQQTLLTAFSHALKTIPSARLLIVGAGSLDGNLRQSALQLGIDENVHFLGRRSDVAALFELSDVFVFPSVFEGLSLALIEAMSKSMAVVASRIDSSEEVIEDGVSGLLVDPLSDAEIASAIVRIYEDNELKMRLGTNAFLCVKDRFNAENTARQWEEMYFRIYRTSSQAL